MIVSDMESINALFVNIAYFWSYERHQLLSMSVFKFRYNSNHKIITVIIVMAWAIVHFMLRSENDKHYRNGQVKIAGKSLNSKNHGRWTWYYENGFKRIEGDFNLGKREGLWVVWDSLGNKISESNYLNDKLNGVSVRLDTAGNVIDKQLWEHDVLIKVLSE